MPDDLTRLALFDLSAHSIQRRVIVYIVEVKLVISGSGNVDDVVLGRITHSSLQNGVIRLVDCILTWIVGRQTADASIGDVHSHFGCPYISADFLFEVGTVMLEHTYGCQCCIRIYAINATAIVRRCDDA